ncbi:MAG TPA: sigma 54-interacting transcriptional regulator [Gemmatimonadales bacterium]|nr:sigma 54-interacting transcriptional regulator [Gemmatimonadales bacterium]
MIKTVALAKRFAPLPRAMALVGETGVGKRLLARFIHSESGRTGAFVTISGGDPTGLMPQPEAFEQAQNGTVFLHDLPLWPLASQRAVLDAMEERRFARRGTERYIPLTSRLIVASQRPLDELVDEGRLLPGLRWFIGEFVIDLPPLRGRFVDIAALSYHFLDRAREESGGAGPRLVEAEALDRLITYRWPGNVRQLRDALGWSYLQAAADGIRIIDLPRAVIAHDAKPLAVDLAGRRELSRWAFERTGGSRQRAAQLLGVHPNTIDNHRRAAAQ